VRRNLATYIFALAVGHGAVLCKDASRHNVMLRFVDHKVRILGNLPKQDRLEILPRDARDVEPESFPAALDQGNELVLVHAPGSAGRTLFLAVVSLIGLNDLARSTKRV
jgi:hypothetical protein